MNFISNEYCFYSLNSSYQKRKFLQKKTGLKATVFLEEGSAGDYVVKDYSHINILLRHTLCRYLIKREIKALRHLEGIEGVPSYFGRYGKFGFSMQFIKGMHPSKDEISNSKVLMEKFEALISQFHERGLTHNDLRMKNMLIDKEGKLYIVDYASAIIGRIGLFFMSPMGRFIYRILLTSDKSKIAKLKQRNTSFQLTDVEKRILLRSKKWHRFTDYWKALRRALKHRE